MIEVQNITKSFGSQKVLNNISLTIKDKEIVSISGASGAGKTTLLNIMGSLDKPDSGKVFIKGQDITTLKDKELCLFRNKEIGFVFQFHYLLKEFTALENAIMPYLVYHKDKKEAIDKAKEIFSLLKINGKESSYPDQLSGGECQRVAICRALINSPSLVLADEPSGNLDSKNAKSLFELFFVLREKYAQTFVVVTHSQILGTMSDRQFIMTDGKILE